MFFFDHYVSLFGSAPHWLDLLPLWCNGGVKMSTKWRDFVAFGIIND